MRVELFTDRTTILKNCYVDYSNYHIYKDNGREIFNFYYIAEDIEKIIIDNEVYINEDEVVRYLNKVRLSERVVGIQIDHYKITNLYLGI